MRYHPEYQTYQVFSYNHHMNISVQNYHYKFLFRLSQTSIASRPLEVRSRIISETTPDMYSECSDKSSIL